MSLLNALGYSKEQVEKGSEVGKSGKLKKFERKEPAKKRSTSDGYMTQSKKSLIKNQYKHVAANVGESQASKNLHAAWEKK